MTFTDNKIKSFKFSVPSKMYFCAVLLSKTQRDMKWHCLFKMSLPLFFLVSFLLSYVVYVA